MRIKELKDKLEQMSEVHFLLPNGEIVPAHYHITEIGVVDKHYIDCGGVERKESTINFQLWTASDYDHRMNAQKLLSIIEMAEKKLAIENHKVEVEYQGETIGKFNIIVRNNRFQLEPTYTNCLAPDKCEIPKEKPRVSSSNLATRKNQCDPESGCC